MERRFLKLQGMAENRGTDSRELEACTSSRKPEGLWSYPESQRQGLRRNRRNFPGHRRDWETHIKAQKVTELVATKPEIRICLQRHRGRKDLCINHYDFYSV